MIRPGVGDDAAAIAAVEAACFDDAWTAASIADELASPTRAVVVDTDGRGYAIVMVAPPTADLLRIAVLPGHRRTGLAAALLEAGLAEARARGAESMLLEVAEDNAAARALYATAGFTEISRRRGYYAGGVDGLVLQRGTA